MRDRERDRLMEKMRGRDRDRETAREGEEKQLQWGKEEYLAKRMGFFYLNPLRLTIYHLLVSSRVSIDPRSRAFLMFADYGVKDTVELLKSLEEFRSCIESRRMKGVEAEIREAARKLEDVLDSHVSEQFFSQSENEKQYPLLFSLNLQGIEQDIDGFVEKMMEMEKLLNPWLDDEEEEEEEKGADEPEVSATRTWFMSCFATQAASRFSGMKEEYIQELEKLLPEDEGDDFYSNICALLTDGFTRSKSEDRVGKIKDELTIWWINKAASIFVKDEEEPLDSPSPKDDVSSRVGNDVNMVGLTHLFCELKNDLIEYDTKFRVGTIFGMAGIGKTALAKKILQDPLISSKFECRIFVRLGPKYQPEEIMRAVLAQMPGGDRMMMLGDRDLVDYLRETIMRKIYLIVLDDVWDRNIWNNLLGKMYPFSATKSWLLVTTRINRIAHIYGRFYRVPFLNKEESWDLLRKKIFGEKSCHHELEKVGKKIAENCEGLPLLILVVADLLFEVEKTPECWSKIAANKTNSIFVEAYEQILEVLYPSYSDLPQHLKACFLYLGAFPQNDVVRVSKLIALWSADGFLGVSYAILQEYVGNFLYEIVCNNVALETQGSFGFMRACSLHSVFWYLCKREAWNEKFLLVLNSHTDVMVEGTETRRRLSVYKNIILSIKHVCDSIASMSAVHSLLCTGPYHQYEVPIYFGLRLIKVLYALTIRFYEFPLDVLKLIRLRYLSLTCNENLPPSISKLWSLQSLILHQHLSIKSSASQSYLPVEIWDLQELEHLQIVGRNLPDPPPGAFLRNLSTLLGVGVHTCTARVLGSIPNLEELSIQIELMPVASETLRIFHHISLLRRIKSLKFVVMNPDLMFEIVAPPTLVSFSSLTKLTLSGMGYPWEYMTNIAQCLFHLEELKLKSYAFRGEKWQVKEGEFEILGYLSIEDTDLVKWTGFLVVQRLTIKHCYKLQEIPKLSSVREIQLGDCNPLAVTCAKKMTPDYCRLNVESSWLDDRKLS